MPFYKSCFGTALDKSKNMYIDMPWVKNRERKSHFEDFILWGIQAISVICELKIYRIQKKKPFAKKVFWMVGQNAHFYSNPWAEAWEDGMIVATFTCTVVVRKL